MATPYRNPDGSYQPPQGGYVNGTANSFTGQIGDYLKDFRSGGQGMLNWMGENQGTANLNEDKKRLQLREGSPYVDKQSPYAQQYGQLINMLTNRANGMGPSVAGDAYKQSSDDAMQRILSASYAGNPGAARAGFQQMGNVNQGLAQGYAQARDQEIAGATGQLGSTINSASNEQLLRDKANQEAWLKQLSELFGADKAESQQGKSNMGIAGGFIQSLAGG